MKKQTEHKMRVPLSDLPEETIFKIKTSQEAINTIKWPVKAEVVIGTTVYELMNTSFITEVNNHQKKTTSWQDSDEAVQAGEGSPGEQPETAGNADHPAGKNSTPYQEAESDSKPVG